MVAISVGVRHLWITETPVNSQESQYAAIKMIERREGSRNQSPLVRNVVLETYVPMIVISWLQCIFEFRKFPK